MFYNFLLGNYFAYLNSILNNINQLRTFNSFLPHAEARRRKEKILLCKSKLTLFFLVLSIQIINEELFTDYSLPLRLCASARDKYVINSLNQRGLKFKLLNFIRKSGLIGGKFQEFLTGNSGISPGKFSFKPGIVPKIFR